MGWLFWSGIAALCVYEGWALLHPAAHLTISEKVWRGSSRPLLPFALGLLAGHLVWQAARCLPLLQARP